MSSFFFNYKEVPISASARKAIKERDEAVSELKFINKEYRDIDSEELTRDALILKMAAISNERNNLQNKVAVLQERLSYSAETVTKLGNRLDSAEEDCESALQKLDALCKAVLNLDVLRSSCADSNGGIFRVHLNELKFKELLDLATANKP